jgi:quinoprotein glucose dehydrogenase
MSTAHVVRCVAGIALAGAVIAGCERGTSERPQGPATGWPVYASNAAGTRYSAANEITPANVRALAPVWEYHTGDLRRADEEKKNHSFEATPVLVDGALYLCTQHSFIISLDPESGRENWKFDPEVESELGHYNLNCRGVAHWVDRLAADGAACKSRIYVATADTRLIAVDAVTGRKCETFGERGEVAFWRDMNLRARGEFGISSPPVIVNDVIVLGSSVAENRRVDMPSGKVHAFHARTGAALWTWDPIPKDPNDPARATWENGSADRTGAANVWSLGSGDPERDLVFVPTSSPSPDFYGGERLGDNRHADSVVALRASTGELVWHFQTVHHDLWDYDLASQPVLIDFPMPDGRLVPAVAQGTKMGNLFFLHRETGEPLVPVEERPVPQTTVPGERTSPTQPFPTWPPPLVRQSLAPEEAWGLTPIDRRMCQEVVRNLDYQGIFTPPSLRGSILLPGSAGGSNWGSVAWDAERQILVANVSNVAQVMQLIPRESPEANFERNDAWAVGRSEQEGTPYIVKHGVLLSPWGIPCNPPPWGKLMAFDLANRKLLWESTLGTTRDMAPLGIGIQWGTPNMGGSIVTASGLVFVAATMDDYLRAFDLASGEELWKGRLPAGGQATPMTYRLRENGRQYVVIAAGGHHQMRTRQGDSVIAFALPE